MTLTVPLCVRRGCGSSIRSVKAKNRNEPALERATSSRIDEQSFLVKIRDGGGDKTLSHYARVHEACKENPCCAQDRHTPPDHPPQITRLG
jgi:hypothetical protein